MTIIMPIPDAELAEHLRDIAREELDRHPMAAALLRYAAGRFEDLLEASSVEA